MHPQLQLLSIAELVERLEDLDGRRTPVGWTPEDAVERTAIEGRILALITAAPDSAGDAMPCAMEIQLRSKEQTVPARIAEVRPGGVYVETIARFVEGTHVEMHVRHDTDEHGLRARGIIRRVDRHGVLVSVAEQPSEAHERRLRRFILELLRHRLHS
jgi:hypothetical protein